MHKSATLLVFALLLLMITQGNSQQAPYLGLFQENWVLINPAFLDHAQLEKGENTMLINSSYRQQWLGFDDGPQQMNIRFEQILTTDRQNAWDKPLVKWGLGFTREQVASFTGTGFFSNFGYIARLGDQGITMGGGFNFGVQGQGIRLKSAQFEDWGADQFAQSLNDQQSWLLNADAGLFFRKNVKRSGKFYDYYFGLSATQLISANLRSDSMNLLSNKRPPHLNLLWGCLIKADQNRGNAYLEPSIWIRHLPGVSYLNPIIGKTPVSVDLSLRIHLENQFWFGAGYGTAGNINAAFGYQYARGGSGATKIKGGLLMNVPVSQRALGYSMEAFLGIALAQ